MYLQGWMAGQEWPETATKDCPENNGTGWDQRQPILGQHMGPPGRHHQDGQRGTSILLGARGVGMGLSVQQEIQTRLLPLHLGGRVPSSPVTVEFPHHPAKFPEQQRRDLIFRARKRFLGTEPHLQQSQTELDSHRGRPREKWLWNRWSCHFIKEQRKRWWQHERHRGGRTGKILKRSSFSSKSQAQIWPYPEQPEFISHCSSLWLP